MPVLSNPKTPNRRLLWPIQIYPQVINRRNLEFSMKACKSNAILLGQSITIKQVSSPTSKKIEGFDRTTLSSTFTSKIDKLKNKPKTQVLEDQYIKGLQDEIKYLEMELKLLQEKDQEKHGQIDQLERFFGDGIPINENILAIKNGFNNYKSVNEKKIKQLGTEKQERVGLIDGLGVRVEKLLQELNRSEVEHRTLGKTNLEVWWGLLGSEAGLKKSIEKEEQQLKLFKQQNRQLTEKIEKIARNKLIENITVIKYENSKMNRLNALRESITEKETELLERQKQLTELAKQQQDKAYVIKLEEDNLNNKKRCIALERQYDNIRSKIKEKTMDLEERLKGRMAEVEARMEIKARVDDVKEAINRGNSLTVEEVAQNAREKEIQHLQRIIDNNRKIAKYTDHYSNLLSSIEGEIQTLAQRKPEVKSQIAAYSQQVCNLKKKMKQEKEREISIHAQLEQLEQKFGQCKQQITPLQQRTKKNNDQIEAYLQERRRLLEEIKVKEKQLELIFIVRGLSFDETEISKSSNKNIQEELIAFLKNWEKIQRDT